MGADATGAVVGVGGKCGVGRIDGFVGNSPKFPDKRVDLELVFE